MQPVFSQAREQKGNFIYFSFKKIKKHILIFLIIDTMNIYEYGLEGRSVSPLQPI